MDHLIEQQLRNRNDNQAPILWDSPRNHAELREQLKQMHEVRQKNLSGGRSDGEALQWLSLD